MATVRKKLDQIPLKLPTTCTAGQVNHALNPSAVIAWAKTEMEYALQPIVNVHSGVCYGMEALIRGHEKLGFTEIKELLDYAADHDFLGQLDVILRERAIGTFAALNPQNSGVSLFFNLDNRIAASAACEAGVTHGLLGRHNLPPETIVFEISERHHLLGGRSDRNVLTDDQGKSFRLAVDDFGAGYNGLTALFETQPEFVKIDQFFVRGVDGDGRKRVFLNSIVKLAHALGAPVIAEGVETQAEFRTCKEIGCDMIQGFFISPPKTTWSSLPGAATQVATLSKQDRRDDDSDAAIIFDQVEAIKPINVDTPMEQVFDRFRSDKHMTFFPIVDPKGHPIGLIRENDLKDFTYSTFGKELINNKAYSHRLRDFATPCPTADIRTEAEKILELFSLSDRPEGILITRDFKYLGFLSAASLLRVINEKNLSYARDQNPLSKLPGNNVINQFMAGVIDNTDQAWTVVYFDFNNFKPFNDTYGFRQGDRAILLFSELLGKTLPASNTFVGHIGGDDFFAGFCNADLSQVTQIVSTILQRFSEDVRSFYSEADRLQNGILSTDRTGQQVRYPLLACSAAILHILDQKPRSLEAIMSVITEQKKSAKQADDHLSVAYFIG